MQLQAPRNTGMSITTTRTVLVAVAALLATQPLRHSNAQAASESPRPDSYYVLLTQGMLAGPVYTYPFSTTHFRVEVRNLIVGHATAHDVPIPTDVVMELRSGAVTTAIGTSTQERTEGDFWTVAKGSHLDVENQGQVAVIRAIYIYKE
jgi:hypothetical protein